MVAKFFVLLFATGALAADRSNANAVSQRQLATEAAWDKELSAEKVGESPVKRVVNLLAKMKSELEGEAGKESEMYDKMVCWCDTNTKEKTKAVADAEAKDKDLTSEIEGRSARFGELSANIATMKKQIGQDTATLKESTALREGGAAEFRGEEKDLVQAINNLKNAIAVLGRHQSGGSDFLQLDAPIRAGMNALLRDLAVRYEVVVATEEDRHRSPTGDAVLLSLASGRRLAHASKAKATGEDLLQALDEFGTSNEVPVSLAAQLIAREAKSAALLQETQPNTFKSYNTRSSKIFGIMNQMLEDFEAKLATAQGQDAKSAGDAAALIAAKESQLEVGKKKLDNLQAESADNQKKLSDAKEDLDITRKQRTADVEFLRNLKLTCNDLDAKWESRSAKRSDEITAVSETIAILTEDDNREMLAKSVSLFQETSWAEGTAQKAVRASAARMLRKAATDPVFDTDDLLSMWHDRSKGHAASGPRSQLSTLAMSVQLDSFTKVKEMMDKLVAELSAQQEEEVKFKSYCGKELNENQKATYAKNEEKVDLESQVNKLDKLMAKLNGEITVAKSQIAEGQIQIKKASQNRENENAEFQQVVADQRATQDILKKALVRLEKFYKAAFIQKQLNKQLQTPPVQFNDYKKNADSSPVMGLLEQIIGDSKKLEAEAVSAETAGQADYEKFVKDSNSINSDLGEAVMTKNKNLADARKDKADATGSLASATGELESLGAYEADLHGECDWLLANFAVRQQARLQEMEAIKQAKAFLAGQMG